MSLKQTDTYVVSPPPAGLVVTLFPGGSFRLAVATSAVPGTYPIQAVLNSVPLTAKQVVVT